MPEKKLVLLVEDDRYVSEAQKNYLEDANIKVIIAESLKAARTCLKQYGPALSLILLDACLQSSKPNSMPLIAEARNCGFDGPIIASSSSYSQPLVDAGALPAEGKREAIKLAIQLLQ